MNPVPYTYVEWTELQQAMLPVVNATLAGDCELRAILVPRLFAVLASLQQKYGEHPVLLETKADFTDDPAESVALYVRAKRLAQANNLPIASICMSLANVLLNELGQAEKAREQMMACQTELPGLDEFDREQWARRVQDCDLDLANSCP